MTELMASGPSVRPLRAKLIMTVLLTLVIGPLVGTILVLLADATGLTPEAISMFIQDRTRLSVLVLGFASGGMQALICGLTFALFGVSGDGLIFSLIIHIVPALATWWLLKAYWQRIEA
ncbi:MAG TPA: hypothetical protein VL101_02190 [Nordella sp.]|nr:hypothetical protein [Nordella sp.]